MGLAPLISELVGLVVAAALVNNIVLVQLLGVTAATQSSFRIEPAIDIAILSSLLIIVCTTVNSLLHWLLLKPLNLEVLNLIVFATVCAASSSFLATKIEALFPLTARQHTIGLYLAGTNSAVIGLALQRSQLPPSLGNFVDSLAISIGTAIGFSFVMIAFAALRLRLSTSDTPAAFRDGPVILISAGLAAMSMLGFAGLI